jgi:hypothetical protein
LFNPPDTVTHTFSPYITRRAEGSPILHSLYKLTFIVMCAVHIGYLNLDPSESPKEVRFTP